MAIKLENATQIKDANTAVEEEDQNQKRCIPGDVVYDILSRLPVKSLIRFQTLSKSYRSTISSDPWFSKINYIHQSNKSDNLFLRLTDEVEDRRLCGGEIEGARIDFTLVRLVGENMETVTELGNPFGAAIPLCCCNGIVLLALKWPGEGLVLWNPSIRRHAMIPSPPDLISWFEDYFSLHYGLYHDTRADDYTIVIISPEYNLLFSCKTRTWIREEPSPSFRELKRGVFLDGCFYYWQSESEVACFDFRERELGKLTLPEMNANPNDVVTLTAMNSKDLLFHGTGDLHCAMKGCLCVYCIGTGGTKFRVWVMRRPSCSWTELSNLEETAPHFFLPGKFSIGIAFSSGGSEFIRYDHLEKRFFIDMRFSDDVWAIQLLPYSESLFFPLLGRN